MENLFYIVILKNKSSEEESRFRIYEEIYEEIGLSLKRNIFNNQTKVS